MGKRGPKPGEGGRPPSGRYSEEQRELWRKQKRETKARFMDHLRSSTLQANRLGFLEWENQRLQNCLSKLLEEVKE